MDEGGRRVEEKRRRRRRRRPAEMQTALLGHSPLHVTANIFTSYTSISPTLFYNIHLHLSSHAQLLVSLSLFSAPELCLFSPPSTSYLLTSPPPGSTPSLRSSRRQKKRHLAATHPLLSPYLVLLLSGQAFRYKPLLSSCALRTYLSFSLRFLSFLAGLELPRIVNM